MLNRLLQEDEGATLLQVIIGGVILVVVVMTAAKWGGDQVDKATDQVTTLTTKQQADVDAFIAREFKCKSTAGGGGNTGGKAVTPMVDYLAVDCQDPNPGAQVTGQVGSNQPTVQRQPRTNTGDAVNPRGGVVVDPGPPQPVYTDPPYTAPTHDDPVYTDPPHDPGYDPGHSDSEPCYDPEGCD